MCLQAYIGSMKRIAFIVATLLASSASAEDECASSFPARLADAQRGLKEHEAFLVEYEKARPTVEWFEAHCRFLEDIEIVVRKLDDQASFVCDPKVKGRPKNLTAELVLTYSIIPTVNTNYHGENHRCAASDRATRIQLIALEELSLVDKLEVLCFQSDKPKCVVAREKIAEARARGLNKAASGTPRTDQSVVSGSQ